MKQKTYLEQGAIRYLKDVLGEKTPERIFLVTGKSSYFSSGAEAALSPLLQGYRVTRFYKFDQNPKIEDLEVGLEIFRKNDYDLIIAIGGGSVLDMGKLIKIMAAQNTVPTEIVLGKKNIQKSGVPLIAIPTTAGTGSEATHFAVIYLEKTKYSVAHEYVLPDIAILDSVLTHSMPPKLTAVTGMDAFSQAVESYWSINSTDESKTYAREAIELSMQNLEKSVNQPMPETRHAMCKAAHLAGRAINISKTTAPHAVSYALTSHFGIPHGHAVSLSLGEFLVFNSEVDEADIIDPRGREYVRSIIGDLCRIMEVVDANHARNKINELMREIGLESRLGKCGINDQNHELIINSLNIERLQNNPRRVTPAFLKKFMKLIT